LFAAGEGAAWLTVEYDQAHRIGEFRALFGTTPEALARGHEPDVLPCSV
jgi:hypothetical protein